MLHHFNFSEALNASLLHAMIVYSAFTALSELFFRENYHLMLYPRYVLKEIHRLTLHRCYFFTITLRQPMLSRNCHTSLSLDRSDMVG
jgi:hypothetical protein